MTDHHEQIIGKPWVSKCNISLLPQSLLGEIWRFVKVAVLYSLFIIHKFELNWKQTVHIETSKFFFTKSISVFVYVYEIRKNY